MIVLGKQITDEQISACIARMKVGYFKAADIVEAAKKAGAVGNYIPERLADRLIQQQRNNLTRIRQHWVWRSHPTLQGDGG